MTTTPPLTWGGLTPEMQARLVAISRGEKSKGDRIWTVLRGLELIDYIEEAEVDYLTEAGGKLIAERDAIMVAALTAYANGEYLGKGKAQAALAQVQEGGEHE